MKHLDSKYIIEYMAEKLPEPERLEMDEHVLECRECLEKMKTVLFLGDHFQDMIESWSLREYQCLLRNLRILKVLADSRSSLTGAVMSWLKTIRKQAEVTFNLILNPAGGFAGAAVQQIPAGFDIHHRPMFAGVGSPFVEASVREHLDRGHSSLLQGDTESAAIHLEQASQLNRRAALSDTIDIQHRGDLAVRFLLDAAKQRALVMYWPSGPGRILPVAFLIPHHSGNPARIAPFTDIEAADYKLAEFSDLEDREYELVIGLDLPESPDDGAA